MIDSMIATKIIRQRVTRYVQVQLWDRHGENTFPQLFAYKQAKNFEWGLKPQRSGHNQDFFQSRWIAALERDEEKII